MRGQHLQLAGDEEPRYDRQHRRSHRWAVGRGTAAALIYVARTGNLEPGATWTATENLPPATSETARHAVRAGVLFFVLGLGCVAVAIAKLS